MNRHSPPTWQQQYDFASRVVESTIEILARPDVIDELGYKSRVLALAMESVKVRPVKNGGIEWGEDDNRTTIHVVSLAPGESIQINETASNEHQYAYGKMLYGEEETQRLLIRDDTPIMIEMDDSIAGVTNALARVHLLKDPTIPLQFYVRGRPTIALKYEEYYPIKYSALTMTHELDHALNATVNPMDIAVCDQDYYLRNELSAYSTQSMVAHAIGISDQGYLAHIVERIRNKYNGDLSSNEAFRTDTGVAEALEREGLGDIHD